MVFHPHFSWTVVVSERLRDDFPRLATAIAARRGVPLREPSVQRSENTTIVWIVSDAEADDPAQQPRLRLSDEPLKVLAPWNERRLPRGSAAEVVAETAELLAWTARFERERAVWQREAYTDAATGLLNRRGWEAEEIRWLAREGLAALEMGLIPPVGLILLDLDDFHFVNERFSHAAGDACLQCFGKLLLDEVARRGGNCRGVRVGGDEFALWIPDASREETAALAERVVATWNALATDDGHAAAKTTVSAGWTWWAKSPETATIQSSAFQAADQALLAAKRAGKARVVAAT